jgi:hypothetical protein
MSIAVLIVQCLWAMLLHGSHAQSCTDTPLTLSAAACENTSLFHQKL